VKMPNIKKCSGDPAPTFKAPFARASREADYRVAWAFFEEN